MLCVSETKIQHRRRTVNNRILGTIGLIVAPAMLIEAFVPGGSEMPFVVGTASMLFMLGSFASHVGLWRIAATGRSWWGRGVLILQLVLVALAFLFGLFEATGLIGEENILFTITDIAWPVSMLAMNLVGITIAAVGKLRGWQRFAPLLPGLALPISIVLGMVTGAGMQGDLIGYVFFGMLAVFWGLLGLIVRQSEPAPAPLIAPVRSAA
jgi:hypothetical protein